MKAEKYLLDYMLQCNISQKQVETDKGFNIEKMIQNKQELKADEFIDLCAYLNVDPDDVMNAVVG